MSSVAISGNASGTGVLTVASPNTNSSYTLTLPAATTTLVGTDATQTLTNKTLTSPTITGAVVSSMASSVITSETVKASTSGTSVVFETIPSWVKRITVMLQGVSTNGTAALQVQIGSSTYTTSGYSCYVSSIDGASTNSFSAPTTGFVAKPTLAAASTYTGTMVLNLLTGNTWMFTGSTAVSNGLTSFSNGYLALGGTLDRLRVIASATGTPADTFDLGNINIFYE